MRGHLSCGVVVAALLPGTSHGQSLEGYSVKSCSIDRGCEAQSETVLARQILQDDYTLPWASSGVALEVKRVLSGNPLVLSGLNPIGAVQAFVLSPNREASYTTATNAIGPLMTIVNQLAYVSVTQ